MQYPFEKTIAKWAAKNHHKNHRKIKLSIHQNAKLQNESRLTTTTLQVRNNCHSNVQSTIVLLTSSPRLDKQPNI